MERRRCARHSRAQKTFCTHGSWNTLADFRRQFYISLTVNRVTAIQMKSGDRSCRSALKTELFQMKSGPRSCRSALTTAQCSCSTATYLHVDLRRSSIPLKKVPCLMDSHARCLKSQANCRATFSRPQPNSESTQWKVPEGLSSTEIRHPSFSSMKSVRALPA